MTTSGTRTFIASRNEIINAALRKLGVLGQGQVATGEMISEAAFALNVLVLSWQNEGVFLWTKADDILPLTADTASYALDADVLEVGGAPFFRRDDSDTPITFLTRDEYKAISDKTSSGDPSQIYVDYQLAQPTLYCWPVPENSTSIVVGTDTNNYLCRLSHTAAASNRPITGADYATYWTSTTETGAAWVTATAYKSDVIYYSKILRLQDFNTGTNNPDFPVRYYDALIWGLADALSDEYPAIPSNKRVELNQRAIKKFVSALKSESDGDSLFISPKR